MSDAIDPWELLYEKHRALFEKAASQPLSRSDRHALIKALGELAELTAPVKRQFAPQQTAIRTGRT